MYNYCRKHSKDVTDGRQKKWLRYMYIVKGELANNKQIYRYFTGFVPFLNQEYEDFSVTFKGTILIIQGLHAVNDFINAKSNAREKTLLAGYRLKANTE